MKLHKMIFIKQEPVVALTLKIGSEVNIRIEATVFSRSANVVLSLKTLQKKKQKTKTSKIVLVIDIESCKILRI